MIRKGAFLVVGDGHAVRGSSVREVWGLMDAVSLEMADYASFRVDSVSFEDAIRMVNEAQRFEVTGGE